MALFFVPEQGNQVPNVRDKGLARGPLLTVVSITCATCFRQFEQHSQHFTAFSWENTHVKRVYLMACHAMPCHVNGIVVRRQETSGDTGAVPALNGWGTLGTRSYHHAVLEDLEHQVLSLCGDRGSWAPGPVIVRC